MLFVCWIVFIMPACSDVSVSTPDLPEKSEDITDSLPQVQPDSTYVTLNKATEGKGIDLVIVGDGFTQEDIAAGKWKAAQDSVMKYMFQREPLKSFKHWFNVYAAVPAPYEGPDLSVPLDKGDTVKTHLSIYTSSVLQPTYLKKDSIFIYAYENTPVKSDKGTPKDMLVLMTINSTQPWGSFTTFDRFVDRKNWGRALVPFSVFYHFTIGMYGHEMIGHGIGDCADEYIGGNIDKEFPWDDPNFGIDWYLKNQREKNINLNVTFSTNPDNEHLFVNRAWAWMIKNNYRGVGSVEGAAHCGKKIWRATQYSIMVGNQPWVNHWYINPVQRELILRNLYKLAGKDSEYSFNVFLEYDKCNEEWDKHPERIY